MKNKRFLALTTALTLALSLTVPALAAAPTAEELAEKYGLDTPLVAREPMPPEWIGDPGFTVVPDEDMEDFEARFKEEYTATHPEEYANFDADAFFEEEWSWLYTKEEAMEVWELADEAAFREVMWEMYLRDTPEYQAALEEYDSAWKAQRIEDYRAAHPGELEALDMNALLAAQGYSDPLTTYMNDNGYDSQEEALRGLQLAYIGNREQVESDRQTAEEYRAADPASWTDFDADAYFAQEYPWWTVEEYMSSYSLMSREEFVEKMYVEYMMTNGGGWNEWGDPRELTLVVNGETVGYESDGTLTAENGVTYLPAEGLNAILGTSLTGEKVALRPAAEAAGWDVTWNAGRNQVVLLDRETLKAQAPDLTLLDELVGRLMDAAEMKEGQSYKTTETCDFTFTAFNSLDGDETVAATVKVETVLRDRTAEVTLTLSGAELMELLSQQTQAQLAAQLPKFNAQNLKTLLAGAKVTLLWNGETGELCVNAPILSLFDETITENTWFHWDTVGMEDMGSLFDLRDWNTGDVLYNDLLRNSAESWDAEFAYTQYTESLSFVTALFGPETLTERDGTITWSLDPTVFDRVSEGMVDYLGEKMDVGGLFKEFNFQVSVTKGGKITMDIAIRPDMDAIAAALGEEAYEPSPAYTALMTWAMGLLDMRLAAQAEGTADQSTVNMEFHWKNQFKLNVEATASRKTTTTAPRITPPAGAEIVDF